MPNILANIAKMDSVTTGTGTLTLGSAVTGYLSFANAGVTNGQVVTYAIEDYDGSGNIVAREVGAGTYSSTGPTLTRDTVYSSTNGGAKINCSGLQYVFVSLAKEDLATYGVLSAANTWSANNTFSANAGFGVAAAANRLTVKSTASNLNNTHWLAQDNGDLAALFADSSDNAWLRLWDGAGTEQFRFRAGGDTFLNATGGNVGIGLTAPTYKLHVIGTGFFSGLTTFDSDISLTTGTDQYIYFDSALRLARNGVGERLVIDSAGNLGVGAPSPKTRLQATAATTLNAPVLGSATNAPFYVTNSDTAYGLLIGNNSADGHVWLQAQRTDATATAYHISLNEAGGGVSIGTASRDPSMTLDVAGTIRAFSGAQAPTVFVVAPNVATYQGSLVFQSYRTGATPPVSGDNLGYIDWRNHVYNAPARILAEASETHGATASGSGLRFATCANGSAALTTRVWIQHNGLTGIGRVPDFQLDVQGSGSGTTIRALSQGFASNVLSEVRQDTGYNPAFLTLRRYNVAVSSTPSSITIGEIRWDGLTTGAAYNNFASIRSDIGVNTANGAPSQIAFATSIGAAANDIVDRLVINARGVLSIVNDLGPDSADTLAVGFRGAPHNDQTGTTYTFARTDAGRAIMFKGTSNATYTIPLSTTTNFPIGTMIIVDNSHFGSGSVTVTIEGATGVGIRSAQGALEATTGRAFRKQLSRGSVVTLRKLDNRSATQSVTSITRSTTTATMTTPANHGYSVGDFIEVAGASQSQYNGTQRVNTVPSNTTLTYSMTSDPGGSASGTLTVRKADLWNATGNYSNV